ncbi:unnamed protein product [Nippostrongylus brasiliensis]|uniref:Transposase n=1 Tax=Nippostrongylus brasiliensis TaxID=27835 RepID=A0A0N4XH34_NIPBR|nr:unnamed protein product [Nippostrongylus brasiliensis]
MEIVVEKQHDEDDVRRTMRGYTSAIVIESFSKQSSFARPKTPPPEKSRHTPDERGKLVNTWLILVDRLKHSLNGSRNDRMA